MNKNNNVVIKNSFTDYLGKNGRKLVKPKILRGGFTDYLGKKGRKLVKPKSTS